MPNIIYQCPDCGSQRVTLVKLGAKRRCKDCNFVGAEQECQVFISWHNRKYGFKTGGRL